MKKLLFEPIKIGSLVMPNRIIFPALTTNYNVEGEERPANFYAEIAKGGAGLIIIGALQALYPGRRHDAGMAINKNDDIPRLKKLTQAIHDNCGKAAAQLAVWNLWAKDGKGTEPEDVSPSGVATMSQLPQFKQAQFVAKSRPLTVEEIKIIEAQLADAAVRALEADFDAIQLQAVAGNLIHRFMNPYTNKREDQYGGSMENRLRMLTETIALIKSRIGDDFPFICRIAGEDMVPWGQQLDDFKKMAPLIERSGVHAFDIMPGWYETRQPRHQMSVPRGAFVYLAEGIKQVVDIPVAAGNRINDPQLAERILAEGKADLISMCRALVADPELPNKAKAGKEKEIRICTGCCRCWDDIGEGKALTCSVNFRAGREGEYVITPSQQSKKVVVVGGGPAGMESARVAALKGHQVTLFEKSDKLGGQLQIAVIPPYKEEWKTTIDYLSFQLHKLGVRVRLNTEASLELIEKENPDAVIVATGASPLIPKIPGIEGKNVATAIDVLTGKYTVGSHVIVVGGGLIGCETAEFLQAQGKQTTILEMLPDIAGDVGQWTRWPLLDRLEEAGVRMETNVTVQKITEKGVLIVRQGKSAFFEADSVVIAVGMKCDDELAEQLNEKISSLYLVGSCTESGRVADAIADGFQAGFRV